MGSNPSGGSEVTVVDPRSTLAMNVDQTGNSSQTPQDGKINQLFRDSERVIKNQVCQLFRESASTIKEKLRENLVEVEKTILFHVGGQLQNSEYQIMGQLTELLSQSKRSLLQNVGVNSIEQAGSVPSSFDLLRDEDELLTKEIDAQGELSTTAAPDEYNVTFSVSRQVALLTDEINETWRTIHDDVRRMMAVAKQKRVTAQLLHDTVDIDKKKYELLLLQKQPELYSYVTCGLVTSCDCVTALENMKECRREITLAEELIGDKYASLISVSSSVPLPKSPVKPAADLKSILPPTISRRDKVRERTRKLIIERAGVRRAGPVMHDDDHEQPARGLGAGRSNVSFGRGRRCALRPDPAQPGLHSFGCGHAPVSQPLPLSSPTVWNQSIPAITWSTAPHWTTTAPPSLTPRMTSRFTATTDACPPTPSAFSPSTDWVPPMTSQNMLLPCQLPEPVAPNVEPANVDLIPVVTSSTTSDL